MTQLASWASKHHKNKIHILMPPCYCACPNWGFTPPLGKSRRKAGTRRNAETRAEARNHLVLVELVLPLMDRSQLVPSCLGSNSCHVPVPSSSQHWCPFFYSLMNLGARLRQQSFISLSPLDHCAYSKGSSSASKTNRAFCQIEEISLLRGILLTPNFYSCSTMVMSYVSRGWNNLWSLKFNTDQRNPIVKVGRQIWII